MVTSWSSLVLDCRQLEKVVVGSQLPMLCLKMSNHSQASKNGCLVTKEWLRNEFNRILLASGPCQLKWSAHVRCCNWDVHCIRSPFIFFSRSSWILIAKSFLQPEYAFYSINFPSNQRQCKKHFHISTQASEAAMFPCFDKHSRNFSQTTSPHWQAVNNSESYDVSVILVHMKLSASYIKYKTLSHSF